MENWVEHHTGGPEAIRTALEMMTVTGAPYLVSAPG